MPIYEYHCDHCGDFEVTQRITEDALKKCPTCRRKVRKLISNTSFQLKGSGWYITDYARKGAGAKEDGGAKAGDAGAGESKGESSAKGEGGGEAKADKKAESKPKSGSAKASAADAA
ncbi:MAG: FmdB family zinc ribbon protein [Candidatus Binatia bacterium]